MQNELKWCGEGWRAYGGFSFCFAKEPCGPNDSGRGVVSSMDRSELHRKLGWISAVQSFKSFPAVHSTKERMQLGCNRPMVASYERRHSWSEFDLRFSREISWICGRRISRANADLQPACAASSCMLCAANSSSSDGRSYLVSHLRNGIWTDMP